MLGRESRDCVIGCDFIRPSALRDLLSLLQRPTFFSLSVASTAVDFAADGVTALLLDWSEDLAED